MKHFIKKGSTYLIRDINYERYFLIFKANKGNMFLPSFLKCFRDVPLPLRLLHPREVPARGLGHGHGRPPGPSPAGGGRPLRSPRPPGRLRPPVLLHGSSLDYSNIL
jgi:hypothetical protein